MSEQAELTVKTPLLDPEEAKKDEGAIELKIVSESFTAMVTQEVASTSAPSPAPASAQTPAPATETEQAKPTEEEKSKKPKPEKPKKEKKKKIMVVPNPTAVPALPNEYKFVHQRIPPRETKLRFILPGLLLSFQLIFIILFAFFGNYSTSPESSSIKDSRQYPLFSDLHSITLLGFGFIMTFLKRYGYSSIGFNLLLVSFAVQWALIVRGWFEWNYEHNASFKIGLNNLIYADFTAIAVLIAFGAVLGKTTSTQLIVLALFGVVAQAINEYINVYLIKAHDVGRSVYVHLFGALFGLAVSKALHFKGIRSTKQASVYHSDLFSLIGTLFLFAYYPSFNGILAKNTISQDRAIVNTFASISASCVVTFALSSLGSKGKFNVMHIQHATIAGGIAIGSVADLNVQIYVALIVGAVAGLLSTIGYLFISPCVTRVLKIHDTCSVLSLHLIPGLIAAFLGALFALISSHREYGASLYEYYPGRIPVVNSTEYIDQNIQVTNGLGRCGGRQAGFQLVAMAITIGIALVGGIITGLVLRLPIFEQLSQEVEMFDDEAQWVTPDDYALKLTFASQQQKPEEPKQENETESTLAVINENKE